MKEDEILVPLFSNILTLMLNGTLSRKVTRPLANKSANKTILIQKTVLNKG